MSGLILSVLMIAGFGLLAGGVYLLRARRNTKQAWLMLLASVIMFANVAIWTIPGPVAEDKVNQP